MSDPRLAKLLTRVRERRVSVDSALRALRHLPFEDAGFTKVDHHRLLRRGIPEVIYGAGKTPAQVAEAFARLARHGPAIATRVEPSHVRAVRRRVRRVRYYPEAKVVAGGHLPALDSRRGKIVVVTAGTSDLPVAEEAAVIAELFGNPVERLHDVGVAGLHRILSRRPVLDGARVLIVVAGMEGALPSVVAGLVRAPVIAVPTSVGYGANFRGLSAFLTMVNSCAPGVGVVNIDNGFGAACLATLINAPVG